MKLIYSILIVSILISGCKNTNELDEFIRLEKQLAEVCVQHDLVNHRNPYQGHPYAQRMGPCADSLIAISNAYDSLILKKDLPINKKDIFYIIKKIKSKKPSYIYSSWRSRQIDSLTQIPAGLDIRFCKYQMRFRLSRILKILNSCTCGGGGIYSTMELHPFLIFNKNQDIVEGEFGLGYNFMKNDFSEPILYKIELSKEKRIIKPDYYQELNIQFEAKFTPNDTGLYTLKGYIKITDPITGQNIIFEDKQTIYVKPAK